LVGRFQRIPPVGRGKQSAVYDALALSAVIAMLVMLAVATVAQRRFARRTAQQRAERQGPSSEVVLAWLHAGCPENEMAAAIKDGRDEKDIKDTTAEVGQLTREP
jgi:heme exporter protein D